MVGFWSCFCLNKTARIYFLQEIRAVVSIQIYEFLGGKVGLGEDQIVAWSIDLTNKNHVIARHEAISIIYRANKPIVERSIAAKAVTFPWWKVTKNQVTRDASLRSRPCPANPAESRAAKFCPVSLPHVIASAKFANAPAIAPANIFCLLSAEAVLLTKEKYG